MEDVKGALIPELLCIVQGRAGVELSVLWVVQGGQEHALQVIRAFREMHHQLKEHVCAHEQHMVLRSYFILLGETIKHAFPISILRGFALKVDLGGISRDGYI